MLLILAVSRFAKPSPVGFQVGERLSRGALWGLERYDTRRLAQTYQGVDAWDGKTPDFEDLRRRGLMNARAPLPEGQPISENSNITFCPEPEPISIGGKEAWVQRLSEWGAGWLRLPNQTGISEVSEHVGPKLAELLQKFGGMLIIDNFSVSPGQTETFRNFTKGTRPQLMEGVAFTYDDLIELMSHLGEPVAYDGLGGYAPSQFRHPSERFVAPRSKRRFSIGHKPHWHQDLLYLPDPPPYALLAAYDGQMQDTSWMSTLMLYPLLQERFPDVDFDSYRLLAQWRVPESDHAAITAARPVDMVVDVGGVRGVRLPRSSMVILDGDGNEIDEGLKKQICDFVRVASPLPNDGKHEWVQRVRWDRTNPKVVICDDRLTAHTGQRGFNPTTTRSMYRVNARTKSASAG